jgi:hypothetical protein
MASIAALVACGGKSASFRMRPATRDERFACSAGSRIAYALYSPTSCSKASTRSSAMTRGICAS